jgi:hypothetical protein
MRLFGRIWKRVCCFSLTQKFKDTFQIDCRSYPFALPGQRRGCKVRLLAVSHRSTGIKPLVANPVVNLQHPVFAEMTLQDCEKYLQEVRTVFAE